ncbi:OmpP1/FadL family transporter [Pontivivens insulae]|uniref:Outer membrane protein transport protein (OMPP1/FadL/TodX) n=1 Tax=Pontivivens insulae TaxID=1639689 RepID=A0A2R8AAK2_9RHOB|nr:outer membrane protein transport protein [Pontivivens insulae]RED13175.1 long-subunit fatty acid transport protein [Pontivivens insulae]SPF29267.1 hypothetical protein POI8812_01574 [Pontivivens insulae]
MKKSTLLKGATILTLSGTTAIAGGLDRSGQPTNIIFEEGRYLEFSVGDVNPSVNGTDPTGTATGDGPSDYVTFGAAFRDDLKGGLSYALILDEPYGSDTGYPLNTSLYQGLSSDLNSEAVTALLRMEMQSGFSVYGGLKIQRVESEAFIPEESFEAVVAARLRAAGAAAAIPLAQAAISDYTVNASSDTGYGYVAGIAYERPEIAMRVALTYHSEVEHENTTTETLTFFNQAAPATPSVLSRTTTVTTDFPQAFNLDFQTGIAADTLLFGRIRWAEYSDFTLDPPAYRAATGRALASFSEDAWSYQLGIGRRFNENWSAAFSVSYEEEGPTTTASALSPVNGRIGYTLGATYTLDNMRITGGINYTDLGDLSTTSTGTFRDNDSLSFGLRIGFQL